MARPLGYVEDRRPVLSPHTGARDHRAHRPSFLHRRLVLNDASNRRVNTTAAPPPHTDRRRPDKVAKTPPPTLFAFTRSDRTASMGQKQKIREAKKASGDLKVDKTTRAGYDRNNVAEVIKRMKQMAKEDTDRFDKMNLAETLERLEASEKVASTIGAAYDVEMERKRALLKCFMDNKMQPPAPEKQTNEGFQEGVLANPANATAPVDAPDASAADTGDESGRIEVSVDEAKRQLANSQFEARRKLTVAKSTREHNDAMVRELREKGMAVPDAGLCPAEATMSGVD